MICLSNLFFDSNGDYMARLRHRQWLLTGAFLLGALMLVLSLFAFPDNASSAQDFVKGFYSGAGAATMVASALFLARTVMLMRNDQARRTAKIKGTDERERLISMRTLSTSGMICFFILVVAVVVSAPIHFTVFCTLLADFFLSAVVVLITRTVYDRVL